MFGFKKKQCAICNAKSVINVGKPLGHLCEEHLLDTYKARFMDHSGRKIIIPPMSPDKYTSYQFETIPSLRSYGLSEKDVAPIEALLSDLPKSECLVMQSSYAAKDFLNLDALETANWKRKLSVDAVVFILSALPKYMNSGGVALPPEGGEDIIIYPLKS